MPLRPQYAAGLRIEPPVSVPVPPRTSPAATAAPVPLDEPPVWCSVFQGLRAGGHGRSNEGPPRANSCMVSFPIKIVPASASLRTVVASTRGTLFMSWREFAVVRIPAVAKASLRPIGIPCSGPRYPPRAISRSAERACSKASSSVGVTNAWSTGCSCSMRTLHSAVSTTGERALRSIRRAAAAMVGITFLLDRSENVHRLTSTMRVHARDHDLDVRVDLMQLGNRLRIHVKAGL